MPPPPQEPPEESAAALPGADNPLCRPYDDPATRLNSEGNSSSPKSLQIVSREHPSSFSTCDAVDDNRFSTSAFCHAYLHPIALCPPLFLIDSISVKAQPKKNRDANAKRSIFLSNP